MALEDAGLHSRAVRDGPEKKTKKNTQRQRGSRRSRVSVSCVRRSTKSLSSLALGRRSDSSCRSTSKTDAESRRIEASEQTTGDTSDWLTPSRSASIRPKAADRVDALARLLAVEVRFDELDDLRNSSRSADQHDLVHLALKEKRDGQRMERGQASGSDSESVSSTEQAHGVRSASEWRARFSSASRCSSFSLFPSAKAKQTDEAEKRTRTRKNGRTELSLYCWH